MQNAYGFGTVVNYSFEQALEQIAQELKKKGLEFLQRLMSRQP